MTTPEKPYPHELNNAIKGFNLHRVTELLDNGADLNNRGSQNHTPLHWALMYGPSLSIVKLLVERGAEVNAVNDYGMSAVIYAASSNHLEILTYLIEQGADLKQINQYGRTALHFALAASYKEAVVIIKEALVLQEERERMAAAHNTAAVSQTGIRARRGPVTVRRRVAQP